VRTGFAPRGPRHINAPPNGRRPGAGCICAAAVTGRVDPALLTLQRALDDKATSRAANRL